MTQPPRTRHARLLLPFLAATLLETPVLATTPAPNVVDIEEVERANPIDPAKGASVTEVLRGTQASVNVWQITGDMPSHLHREHETRRVRHHGVRLGTGSEISIGDFPVSQDSHDPAMHLPKSHHLPQIGADRRRRLLPAIVRSVTSQLELSRREHVLRRRFERLATQRLPPRFDAPTKCGIRRWRVPHSAHPTRATAVSIVCSMGKGIGRFTPFSLWHRP